MTLRIGEREDKLHSLNQTIERLEFKLNALEKINETINLNEHLDIIINKIMQLFLELFDAEYILIVLTGKEKAEFKISCSDWGDEEKEQKEKLLADKMIPGKGIIREVMDKEISTVVTISSSNEIEFEKELGGCIGFFVRNFLCTPLKNKDRKLGVIEIFNKKGENSCFSEEDVKLIDFLSDKIGLEIENARLVSERNQKILELNSLIRATELISSTVELKTLLDVVMQLVMKMMDAEAASLLLLDEEKQKLYFESAQGEKGERIERIYLTKGEGIADWVVQTGKDALVPDVNKDRRFCKKMDRFSGFETKSILCVPLKVKNRIIGVTEVINKVGKGSFTSADLVLLRTLSSQAAIAVEKAKLYRKLKNMGMAVVKSLVSAIDAKHPYTRGQSERVTKYALIIARELGFSAKEKRNVQLAGLLHDVGKIGIPEKILEKNGSFSKEDWVMVKKHPVMGAEILSPIEELKDIIPIIRYHHERLDGTGYPEGLKGEEIPLISRILAIADAFDSMTSPRFHKKEKSDIEALREIKNNEKSQFDTGCAEAFITGYRREYIIRE
ncbi:GAF domain-containing protein [bacterium]|nr:GAF domain-containing protein [bacterium]